MSVVPVPVPALPAVPAGRDVALRPDPEPGSNPVADSGPVPDTAVDPDTPSAPVIETIRIVGWPDPVIDRLGYDPRSLYVETFWLGILGPTGTWLMRLFASGLDDAPEGFDLDLADTARALGLGDR